LANASENGGAPWIGTMATSTAPFLKNVELKKNATAEPSDAILPGVHGSPYSGASSHAPGSCGGVFHDELVTHACTGAPNDVVDPGAAISVSVALDASLAA
jgi:hypothetical protein